MLDMSRCLAHIRRPTCGTSVEGDTACMSVLASWCHRLAPSLLMVATVAAGCTDDEAKPEPAGIGAVLESLNCVEERNFGREVWGWSATYECSVAGGPVRLHKHEGDHAGALQLLSARYDSEHFTSCERSAPFPSGYRVIDGDRWIAVTPSPAAASAVVDVVGGTIQPVDSEQGDGPPVSYPELSPACSFR